MGIACTRTVYEDTTHRRRNDKRTESSHRTLLGRNEHNCYFIPMQEILESHRIHRSPLFPDHSHQDIESITTPKSNRIAVKHSAMPRVGFSLFKYTHSSSRFTENEE